MLDHFSGQNFIMGVYTWTPVLSYRENGGGPWLTKNWDFNTVDFEEKVHKQSHVKMKIIKKRPYFEVKMTNFDAKILIFAAEWPVYP